MQEAWLHMKARGSGSARLPTVGSTLGSSGNAGNVPCRIFGQGATISRQWQECYPGKPKEVGTTHQRSRAENNASGTGRC